MDDEADDEELDVARGDDADERDDDELDDAGGDDGEANLFLREVARIDDLPPPDGELRAGDRLAHFVIGARLGAGSMGAVYEARDEKLGRIVAIKVMRRTSDAARARFLQEARAAAAVTHPNLVTVHEIGEHHGRAFIVMERVSGTTLRGRRSQGDAALYVLREIASGLGAVHAAGIVHRDLKPDNVMLGNDGSVKLLDFGIARLDASSDLAEGTPPMTGDGVVVGTPRYMSPEQAAGRQVDARSDIYSFGVLAKELVADRVPRDIIERCLADDPAARYADGAELLAALPTTHARKRRPTWAKTLLGVVAVFAVSAAGIAVPVHCRDRGPVPRPLAAAASVHAANPAALAAYRGAFQSLHDAQFFEAVRGFEQAVALDPTFAAAHLRLGLAKRWFHSQEEGRKSFEIAVQHRADLDARDRGLLDAAEPAVLRSPYDYRESARRFTALIARYPDDAELMYWLAYDYSELGEQEKIRPLVEQMSEIDPTAAVIWQSRALTLFYLGDLRGAREAALECRRVAPTQGTCAFELQKILDDMGECTELETVLRAWMTASPEEPRAPYALAELLLATGAPRAAAEEMFVQARARLPEDERAAQQIEDESLLAWQAGDFTKLPSDHGPVRDALDRIDIAFETGDDAAARQVAEDYLARSAAFSQRHGTSDADLFGDPTGAMLATLVRTGAITHDELQHRRDAWVRDLDASIGGIYHSMIWAHAYAENTDTPEVAADALAALPRYQPLPTTYWFPFVYGRIGRTFLQGGRPGDALPYLERATGRCLDRDPRDFLTLGLAYEATNKTALACVQYREVIARWSDAKPRSVTAEKARARATALGCPSLRQ